MKKLYYSTCSFASPQIGVIVNSIQNDLAKGYDVVFAHCSGVCTSCYKNENANKANCSLCTLVYNKSIYNQIPGVKIIPVKPAKPRVLQSFCYDNIKELKNVSYKETLIGISVLSFYISLTRNIDFEINTDLKSYFDYILNDCIALVDSFESIISMEQPDCIVVYNGRYYENRVIYDLALKHRLCFESLEVVGGFQEPYYPVTFKGCLPHDYHYRAKVAREVWDKTMLPEQDKIKMASSFYEKKRNGVVVCDKVYTKNQIKGKLPEIKDRKEKIVIFNSSSDEVAALGGDWDSEQLFESQYEATRFILSSINDNYHVYLRIHPNLLNVNHKHHLELYKLVDEFDNITVIPPSDDVSSYALMDIADKVIVFGSTMGVEACYWDKPVILIGPSFYADLDVAYRPKTKGELKEYLSVKLLPKDKSGALIYALFLLDREVFIDKMNFNVTPKWHSIFGLKYRTCEYLHIWRSDLLFKIVEILYREVIRFFIKDKNKVIVRS